MKQRIFLTIALLMAVCSFSKAATKEAYAVYNNGTLTFYYDNSKGSKTGKKYTMNAVGNYPGWYVDHGNDIKKVVFNSTFEDARPKSTSHWFEADTDDDYNSMSKLTTITGIQYLNTSEVTDMRCMFYNCNNLTTIDVTGFDMSKVTTTEEMFCYCEKLETLDVSNWNTSNITNMQRMFCSCLHLKALDVSKWNTSNVTNMQSLFSYCSTLTKLDVGKWNTARVTDISWIFSGCHSLTTLDLSNWNTAKVTNMSGVFDECYELESIDVSKWHTTVVTDMSSMFSSCSKITRLDLSSFNTNKVVNMDYMFSWSSKLKTIWVCDLWNTSNVTSAEDMFNKCSSITGGNGTTYNSNHIGIEYARNDEGTSQPGYLTSLPVKAYAVFTKSTGKLTFYYDNKRNTRSGTKYEMNEVGEYPGWYTDHCNDIKEVVFNSTFNGARPTCTSYWFAADVDDEWNSLSQLNTISNMKYLNTSQVTDMSHMFEFCDKLETIDVSRFNTGNVTNMKAMFSECNALKTLNVSGFNTKNVTNMSGMFSSCFTLEELDVSSWNTAKVTEMDRVFAYCENLKILGVGNWNTAKVTKMDRVFCSCQSMTTFDLSNWNTANVTNMSGVFSECYELESLNVSNWNTANVTDMSYMFDNCRKLTSLDLSSFNTSKVVNMDYMFSWSDILKTIWVSSDLWITRGTSGESMFEDCSSIKGEKGTTYNSSHIGIEYAHIDGGKNDPGYLTYKKPAGITTGAELQDQVHSSKIKVQSESWYTIDGRKLSGKPNVKGIYLHNGKKVVKQ